MCRICAFITGICVALAVGLCLFLGGRQPSVEFTVDGASLTHFDVDPTLGVLYYNLTADIRIRNPNDEDIYSNYIASAVYYRANILKDVQVAPPTVYLHRNETKVVTASFSGRASNRYEFGGAREKSYHFDLWTSYHFGPKSRKWYRSDMLRCELDLKVVANETIKTRVWGDNCAGQPPKYWPSDLPFS